MRPAVDAAIQEFPNGFVAAEVGVFTGDHALSMLQCIPQIKHLYLIDPYEIYEGYKDQCLFESLKGNVEKEAHKNLYKYNDKITWIKAKFSANVIPELLDFIYIDGNHDYEYVMWDISNAWEICKQGAIIGGHDYYNDRYGVKKAVDEFFSSKNIEINIKYIDWWIKKKEFIWLI